MIARISQYFFRILFYIRFYSGFKRVPEEGEPVDALSDKNVVYSPDTTLKNINFGVANAAYGNRFVILPFDYFTSIFTEQIPSKVSEEDKISLSKQNDLSRHDSNKDSVKYIESYERIKNSFLTAYRSQVNRENLAIRAIEEEVFHNKHLLRTSFWNFSNILSVYYRFCNSYLIYKRYKFDEKPLSNKRSLLIVDNLLNTYFIRNLMARYAIPIIEAYCHYRDTDLNQVKESYGNIVHSLCQDFLYLRSYLESRIGEETSSVMHHISRIVLDYHFADQVANKTGLDYMLFVKHFAGVPRRRFDAVKAFTLNASFNTGVDLIKQLNIKFDHTSSFEKKFTACLLFYGTNPKLIPSYLIHFILKGVVIGPYRKVFLSFLKRAIKGLFSEKVRVEDFYKNFPAIKSYGVNDEIFTVDPAMKAFKGNAFLIAKNSFEPTLAGEDGHVNIVNSQICETLLIQTIFLKALYWVCEKNENFDEFLHDYDLAFKARPFVADHRKLIESEVLPVFFDSAKPFRRKFRRSKFKGNNPIDNNFCKMFEEGIYELKLFVDSLDGTLKQKFLAFCDVNYSHGF